MESKPKTQNQPLPKSQKRRNFLTSAAAFSLASIFPNLTNAEKPKKENYKVDIFILDQLMIEIMGPITEINSKKEK